MTAAWLRWRKLHWRDALLSLLPLAALTLAGIWLAYHMIDPAPPRRITIATGADASAYLGFASRYREFLAEDGVELTLQSSGGALDNLARLRNPDDATRVALVQDGLLGAQEPSDRATESGDAVRVVSLGSVSFEPIWIFYRGARTRSRISDLAGLRIGIGAPHSSTQIFATRLLQASGVTRQRAHWLELEQEEALRRLEHGSLDAVFFIDAPDSAPVRRLLQQRSLRPMSLDQAEATARRFPYLHPLRLPHGTLDLGRNLPAQDLQLLATTTTVVATESLHPALVALLMKAMQRTHDQPGLLHAAHEFPAPKDSDFAPSKDAAHYYRSGPPFLQRYLPFWLATLVDRAALVLLPLLAALLPVMRSAPAIYGWRTRRRLYRWYGELKYLEIQLRHLPADAPRDELLHQLDQIEDRVTHAALPLAFAEHAYVLKEHTELVRRRMQAPAAYATAAAPPATLS